MRRDVRFKMEKIIGKYSKLHDACKKYPRIQLVAPESSGLPYIVEDNHDYAEYGFIEVFCLNEEKEKQLRKEKLNRRKKY